MTLDTFVIKYLGKPIDFDGQYGSQCVDVYRQYLKDVLGYQQSPGVKGAADIWATYRKEDFTAIPNTPTFIAKQGDVIIYDRAKSNGWFGHVGVVLFADINKVVLFEQDGLKRSNARIRVADYQPAGSKFGVLRPKR